MDSLYKNGRVRSYILIILIFASFIVSVPLKRRVSTVVNNKIESYSAEFYNQTGLHITYETLSPSLISNFFVKGIKVINDDEQLILSVDKTKVNYHILSLLKKDIQSGISSVVIDGINLDVDQLMIFINQFQKKNKSEKIELSSLRNLIPSIVKLKNISFSYNDKNLETVLNVKSVSVNNKQNESNLEFQVEAQANAEIFAFKRSLSGKIEISGTLEEKIDKSRMNLKFSNLTDGNYKLNKLNLLVFYENQKLEVHTIQTVNPVSLGADYHFNTGDINLQLNADNLKPYSLFAVASKNKQLKKFQNFKISSDTIVKCNIKEKTLDYISDTNAYIPDAVVSGGLNTVITIYGDEKQSEITGLKVSGEKCNISGKLKYVYDTYQLSGLVEMPHFALPNGNTISTELYIDPLNKGFMIFSPQIFIGDRALTALQLSMIPRNDSFDFTFEMSDYSHLEEIEPGMVKMEGSYLSKSKYIQSNITLTSLYLDSLAGLAEQVVEKKYGEYISNIKDKISNYVFSGDVYASTDLKSLSYNVPYVLLANSKKDNQLIMFSMNGTDQNLQLNQLSLIAGKYTMDLSATLDKNPETSDFFFTIDANSNSVPYHFAGTFMPEVCTVTGDYGTDFELRFTNANTLDGHIAFENLPFIVADAPVILSTDAVFNYNTESGPSLQINHFELEGTDTNISVNPRFIFSGNATKYGAQLNSISYSDLYSALQGTADIMLNINERIFDSIGVMANLNNPLSDENISIDFNVSNPEHLPFSLENFKESYYVNLQVLMKDLGLNRFALQKSENNYVSGSLNAFGTIEHPYVALNIEDFSYLIATNFIRSNGNIIVEDRDISISDLNIFYNRYSVRNINANASLIDMILSATGDFYYQFKGKNITAPLELTANGNIDMFNATLSTAGVSGNLIKKEFPLSVSAIYQNKTVNFYSSENAGINGLYTSDGLLQLSLDNHSFMKFNLDGIINRNNCNLDLYDVDADLQQVATYFNIDNFININKGNLTGEVIVTGKIQDPDFNGYALISSGEVVLPWLTKQKLKVEDMNFVFNHNEINMKDTLLSLKSGEKVNIRFDFFLNKWEWEYLDGKINTINKELFPVKMTMPVASLSGDVSVDLDLNLNKEYVEINGACFGENVNLKSSISSISTLSQVSDDKQELNTIPVLANIDIQLGTHASVDFDPILRCVFVPNTKMNVKYDQLNNQINIDGELNLKSGDISYLNRNFYIKSGKVDFYQSPVENPLITINAETREKDAKGQTVKIILDVERQHLLDFEPKFSSIPAKSENEIRTMLGQIALADSNSATNFLFAASDYAIQSTVVRQAENKLRDLCNFDIFSIRTNVLQNTLNMGVSGELSKKNLSIGNFLDNTTVYIGKYLGSSLYLDAMLHVSFEDNVDIDDLTTPGKVLFQPEIGMELESPFANIRVNMAPDINALMNNQFVPSTSVTLSWKIAF